MVADGSTAQPEVDRELGEVERRVTGHHLVEVEEDQVVLR